MHSPVCCVEKVGRIFLTRNDSEKDHERAGKNLTKSWIVRDDKSFSDLLNVLVRPWIGLSSRHCDEGIDRRVRQWFVTVIALDRFGVVVRF